MSDYPPTIVPVNHLAPVPRRIRGYVGDELVVDTTNAHYVWEWPAYPQYYLPIDDVRPDVLVAQGEPQPTKQGMVQGHSLVVGAVRRDNAARLVTESDVAGLAGTVRFEWASLDRWFEEDEEVFVHPRDPYSRVDALRSTRSVRIELDAIVLAETQSPIMVFETGLPTRYYINRTDVRFAQLRASDTETACPYKGRTSAYWSAQTGDELHPDVAWSYDFPTGQLLPIAGLVAFYNEKVDTIVDGVWLDRPHTHFS